SPDLCAVDGAAFSPDGSRLVVTTNDGPAVHVWDLRAIRRRLAPMGLDWDAPPYPESDPAGPSAPQLPAPRVDFGGLTAFIENSTESAESLIQWYPARLQEHPDDSEAYHQRAHALVRLNRVGEAADDLAQAIRLRPKDGHLLTFRARIHAHFSRYA